MDAAPASLGRRISESLGHLTLELVKDTCFANARHHAPEIARGRSILALRDSPLAQGEDALIIGAGPSLHRHDMVERIKRIKNTGFSGTLVATESSMSFCLRHGIVPDLVVTVDPDADPSNSRIVRWFGDPSLTAESLRHDDYFARQDMDPKFADNELRTNAELVELIDRHGSKIRICVASCASPRVVSRIEQSGMEVYWWNPMLDDDESPASSTRELYAMNKLPCLNAGGNVGSACWVMAHAILEKKRIGLLGIDFGYYADTPYSRTQYYREILDLVGPDRLDEVFIRVHNPHLEQDFYTDPAYYWYRDAFLEMAQAAECQTFNCTGGGILFGPGIQWASLEEFASLSATTKG